MNSTGNVDNAGNVNYTTPTGGPDKSGGASKLKGTKVKKFSFSKLFGFKKGGISEPKLLSNRENKLMSDGIGNLMNKYKDYITPGNSKFNREVFDFMRGLGSESAILDEDHAKELFDKIDTQMQEIISPSSTGEQGLKNLLKSLGQEFELDLSPLLKGGNCTGISESANNMLKPFVNVFINRAKQNPAYSFDKNSNEAENLRGMLKNCPRSAATPQPDPTLTPAKPEPEVAGSFTKDLDKSGEASNHSKTGKKKFSLKKLFTHKSKGANLSGGAAQIKEQISNAQEEFKTFFEQQVEQAKLDLGIDLRTAKYKSGEDDKGEDKYRSIEEAFQDYCKEIADFDAFAGDPNFAGLLAKKVERSISFFSTRIKEAKELAASNQAQEPKPETSTAEDKFLGKLEQLGTECGVDISTLVGNEEACKESGLTNSMTTLHLKAKKDPNFELTSDDMNQLKDLINKTKTIIDAAKSESASETSVATSTSPQPKQTSADQPEVKPASVQPEKPQIKANAAQIRFANTLGTLGKECEVDVNDLLNKHEEACEESGLNDLISDFFQKAEEDPNFRLTSENIDALKKSINQTKAIIEAEKSEFNPEASATAPQPGPTPTSAKPESEVAGAPVPPPPAETTPAAQPEIGPASGQPEEAKPKDTGVNSVVPEPKKEEVSNLGDKKPEAPTSKKVPSPRTGENKAPENSSFAQRLAFFQNLNK